MVAIDGTAQVGDITNPSSQFRNEFSANGIRMGTDCFAVNGGGSTSSGFNITFSALSSGDRLIFQGQDAGADVVRSVPVGSNFVLGAVSAPTAGPRTTVTDHLEGYVMVTQPAVAGSRAESGAWVNLYIEVEAGNSQPAHCLVTGTAVPVDTNRRVN